MRLIFELSIYRKLTNKVKTWIRINLKMDRKSLDILSLTTMPGVILIHIFNKKIKLGKLVLKKDLNN